MGGKDCFNFNSSQGETPDCNLLATVETYSTSYTVNAGSSHVHINVQHKNVDGGKGNSWLTTMSTKHKICKKDYVKTASGVGKMQKQLSQG